MELIKRCPTCGAENRPSDMMCSRCFGDISGIAPSGPAVQPAPPPEPVKSEEPHGLALRCPTGASIAVHDGDTVGRDAVGKEPLAGYGTVSRQHARFIRTESGWRIEDLGSANGTYVDGVRVHTGEPAQVSPGNRISLSLSLELVVTEPGAQP